MKQITTFIISLIFSFYTSASGQTTKTFNLSDFCDKEWAIEFAPDTDPMPAKQGWRLSNDGDAISFMYCKDGKIEATVQFYLSDTPVTNFDYNKVGKTPKGKYIVTINKANYVNNLEIMTISSHRMVLKNIAQNYILNLTSN